MTLDEIHQLIANSNKSDWNRIGAPLYNSWIDYSSDGFEGAHTHNERAVHQADVDIAIEWGMERDPSDREEHFPWAKDAGFPDPATHSYRADIFYRGALVDRYLVVSVDGGRAYLPAPRAVRADSEDLMVDLSQAVWLWSATSREVAVSALLNSFSSGDLDGYLVRAGIIIEQDRQRP